MAEYADDSRDRVERARKRQIFNDLATSMMRSVNTERWDGREEDSYRLSKEEEEFAEEAIDYLKENDCQARLEGNRILINWVLDEKEKADILRRKREERFHNSVHASIREEANYQSKSVIIRIAEDDLEFVDDEISHLQGRDYSVSFDQSENKLTISWE